MIRVRGQGKYELLPTASDDVGPGLLDRRDVEVNGVDNVSVGFVRPRHRKSSKSDDAATDAVAALQGGKAERAALLAKKQKADMMELSEKMIQFDKNKTRNSTAPSEEFIEIDVNSDDTLQGFALKFRCPVAELKRVNNLYSSQDIHSLAKLKVPVKKHGLLKELFAKERSKPPSSVVSDLVIIGNDQDAPSDSLLAPIVDATASSPSPSFSDPHVAFSHSASPQKQSSPKTDQYGIRDLENLFPNRDISDCESGSSRRGSASDSESPLVRTFYLSIRDNMRTSDSQSRAAKDFLSKMDADLSSIRGSHRSTKSSLDQVKNSLTSKRILPLSPSPPETALGEVCGLSWLSILGLGFLACLFFFLILGLASFEEARNVVHQIINKTVSRISPLTTPSINIVPTALNNTLKRH